jgi:D-glycero-alpha-D-manno-heptose-7-phosphate kinase
MIIRAKAPLRVGLAGGGTDVSPYCDEFGGYVLNATIDLHSHCTIEPSNDGRVVFVAADRQEVVSVVAPSAFSAEGPLPIHKGVYNRVVRQFNAGRPLSCRLTTYSDAPAGSGLGTSSTMAVAILSAFSEWLSLPLGEYEVAHLAYEIERLDLGFVGGRQDQYAAAFGGFNFMEFHGGDRVIVNPLRIRSATVNEFQSSLMLYYTGVSRDSAKIISEQICNVSNKSAVSVEAMHSVKADAVQMKEFLLKGDVPALPQIFNRSWEAKKRMAGVISNPEIEAVFTVALANGARAGKVSGAGGGGYIMFMIDPCRREEITRALRVLPGMVQRFQFTPMGAQAWTVR